MWKKCPLKICDGPRYPPHHLCNFLVIEAEVELLSGVRGTVSYVESQIFEANVFRIATHY